MLVALTDLVFSQPSDTQTISPSLFVHHLKHHLPVPAVAQLESAVTRFHRHLGASFVGCYLFGSALEGGLQPESDLDLLVCVNAPLTSRVRADLMRDLLELSAWPGANPLLRALEVTVVLEGNVRPWRYPPAWELQFGEWERTNILVGDYEGPVVDTDLAILFSKLLLKNLPLYGPEAGALFDPVPEQDLRDALFATLALWNRPTDWGGDERNVILTLARVWLTLATGAFVPKDVAAERLLRFAPPECARILEDARDAYRAVREVSFLGRNEEIQSLLNFVKAAAAS